MKTISAALCIALALACSRGAIDRADWQKMSQQDRVLYVKSLIGGEKAKDAKGGEGRAYTRPAEEYVAQIDAAYARGDQRDVAQIFSELPH